MSAKPNQGMQRPSLGGIGSIFDQPLARPLCTHSRPWRLTPDGKIVCGVCHPPPPGLEVEWIDLGEGRA